MSKIATNAVRLILLTIVCSGAATAAPRAEATSASAEKSSKKKTHFEKAVELYMLGPSKADEIIQELDLELAERPENSKAYIIKAMTLMGTRRCAAALKVVDELHAVPALKGRVFPAALQVRSQCLYDAGKYAEAKAAIEPFREEFQQKEEWRKEYATLMQAIEKALRSTPKQ
ncbi:MAG TPA: hypothetical protein VEK79_08490 [Thermoanaerobaculia bacterium]|nr:hypothetical protein [Thermoanaerobaculia bacterium]